MRLTHISWKQAEAYFEEKDTILIGTGSIESHGAHLVLGTDFLIPEKIIELMEDEIDILIAPSIPYGACDSLKEYSGTISLSDDGFYNVLKCVVEGLRRHGAKKFIFLNGHGGNVSMLKKVCLELDEVNCLGTIINWWLLASDLNPEWVGGHGGAQETSAVMAINESLVDLSCVKDLEFKDLSRVLKQSGFYDVSFKGQKMMIPRKIKNIGRDGWVGSDHPSRANVDWGQQMLVQTSNFIIEFIQAFEQIKL